MTSHASIDDFLHRLQLEVELEPLGTASADRAAELSAQVSAFTTSGRRWSSRELLEAVAAGQQGLLVRVRDRFGDYGRAGLILYTSASGELLVESWLLNCRILGKRVEHRCAGELARLARAEGCERVAFAFRSTGANGLARDFLFGLGGALEQGEDDALRIVLTTERLTATSVGRPVGRPARTAAAATALIASRWRSLPAKDRSGALMRFATDLGEAARLASAVKAQRTPKGEARRSPFVPPRGETEEALAAIWADVLGLAEIGADDHFLEIGGHSLLATRVVSRIRARFGVELPLRVLFEAPTIAQLASRVGGATGVRAGAIPSIDRSGPLPLSFGQERLWFLDQLEPGAPFYNMPVALMLHGPLDVAALQRAVDEVVRRHEVLRTTYHAEAGTPFQRIRPEADVPLLVVRYGELDELEARSVARTEAIALAQRGFDLREEPPLRGKVLLTGSTRSVLLLSIHHIAADAWSLGVLLRDVVAWYQAATSGIGPRLAGLPVQYGDFAVWERERREGEAASRSLAYWREKLDGYQPLELPTDRPRPAIQSLRGGRVRFELGASLTDALRDLGRRSGATLYMSLLSGFYALLSRYADQDDLTVGTVVAARPRPELEELIGFFVNTLALRTDLSGRPTFLELLERVRETCLGAFAHADLHFERLVTELAVPRDLARSPVFQVMFAMDAVPPPPVAEGGIRIDVLDVDPGVAKFDLTLSIVERGGRLSGVFEYTTALFDEATVQRMARQYEALLEAALRTPSSRVHELPLEPGLERTPPADPLPAPRPPRDEGGVHSLVAQCAEAAPHAIALEMEGACFSYAALQRRVLAVAGELASLGAGRGHVVAVVAERSPSLVVGVLAALTCGAAFVILDEDVPAERAAALVDDCGASVVLSRGPRPAWTARPSLDLDAVFDGADRFDPVRTSPSDPAYLIYTSGSTGRPKAVVVSHDAVVNHMQWYHREFDVGPGTRTLQKSPSTFDTSLVELLGPLMFGGTVVLAVPGGQRDAEYVLSACAENRISQLEVVPSLLRALLELPAFRGHPTLQRILCSGEALAPDLVGRVAELGGPVVHNLYGPTEATITATHHPCTSVDAGRPAVPIGRAIANLQAHVLDDQLRPVPTGIVGELCLGGRGVALGYHGDAALTALRFVPDRFSPTSGQRLYRTGDRVRRLADGTLVFVGRRDDQHKIRGFRVELGEVETALSRLPGVRDAAARVLRDGPSARLVGYVVVSDAAVDAPTLRAQLEARLPPHLVPSAVVLLDALPLNASGKVDRRALPAPPAVSPDAHTEPRTEDEKTVAAIWAQLLRVPRVGVDDDFFALGGDSIATIQLVARMSAAGLRVSPKQVFQNPTVAALVAVARRSGFVAEEGPVRGVAPLAPSQAWFFEHQRVGVDHFNQAVAIDLLERVDAADLGRALSSLVEHHDALRTRFVPAAAGWEQHLEESPPSATLAVISTLFEPGDIEARIGEAQRSLRVGDGDLVRFMLFERPDAHQTLVVVIHHLVIDGLSWRILLEDLATVLDHLRCGRPPVLPPKSTSFLTWSKRLASLASSDRLEAQLGHWTSLAALPSARLPLERVDREDVVAHARRVEVVVDRDTTSSLIDVASDRRGSTLEELLLASLGLALAGAFGCYRITIDNETHGREELVEDVDVTRTVGWFTAVHPLRLETDPRLDPAATLRTVSERLRSVPQRGVGHGIIRYLRGDDAAERLRGASAPEVLWNFLGRVDQALPSGASLRLSTVSLGALRDPRGARSHPLEINASIREEGLSVVFEHGPSLSASSIESLASSFVQAVRDLARPGGPDRAVGFRSVALDEDALADILDQVTAESG